MQTISTHEAKTHLSRYLKEIEAGKQFVIARGRKAVAMLIPLSGPPSHSRPQVGMTLDSHLAVPDSAFAPLSPAELKDWEG